MKLCNDVVFKTYHTMYFMYVYIDLNGSSPAQKGGKQRSCGVCSSSWICECMHSVACVISGKLCLVICAVMQSPPSVSLHIYCLLACKRDIMSVHTYLGGDHVLCT